MGSVIITPTAGAVAPDFAQSGARFVPAQETYATITSNLGNVSGSPSIPGQPHVYLIKATGDAYSHSKVTSIGLDLRDYAMVTFSAGSIAIRVDSTNYAIGDLLWGGVSSRDSVVVSGMNEDVMGVNWSTTVNYLEICQGFGAIGDYSNRNLITTMPVGGTSTFTLNSAGISYLNTVNTKTYNPGYAYFSLIWGGQSDGVAPTTANARSQYVSWDFATLCTVTLTFTSSIQINVGDTWREVIGVQINQSGSSWVYATELNINVGDTWKDIT